jgi:putative flippase GtrA
LSYESGSATANSVATLLGRLDYSALLRRALIYGCVGTANALLYSLAVIACVWLLRPIGPTIATVVAFTFCVPVAYLAHAKVSFSDRPYDQFQPLRFVISTSAAFMLSIGGMYWITEVSGRSYLFGIAWSWLTVPAINFLIYMFWVFRLAGARRGAA